MALDKEIARLRRKAHRFTGQGGYGAEGTYAWASCSCGWQAKTVDWQGVREAHRSHKDHVAGVILDPYISVGMAIQTIGWVLAPRCAACGKAKMYPHWSCKA
jgi:hypothetical protein